MNKFLLPAMAFGLVTLANAQTTVTFPNTLPASYAGNSWPFANTAATGFRTQFIYDGSMLGVKYPVLIQRLRFRRSSLTATTTGSQTQVTCSLSTSPVKWNALTTTFANHVGKDVKTIFTGTMQFNATAWYVDIKLTTPFLYDPSQGDLCFDFLRANGGVVTSPGSGGYASGTATAPFMANRTWGTPGGPASLDGGTTAANGYANACEVTFLPATGLYAGFTATPVDGKSPLKVQFTDASYSSDAGGVKTWAWDFDGDMKTDSTLQNPVFIFGAPGFDTYFDVSLTVTDAAHPANTLTRKKFIRVNPSTAKAEDFGKGTFNKAAPAPIDLPPHGSTYTSTTVRGFYFQAPTTLIINGFEAPNEHTTKQTDQTVTCYVLAAAPPAYSATYMPTAADIKFHGTGKADTILKPTAPIIVQKDQWVAVLGAVHTGATGSNLCSYGTPAFSSSVLGQPITLTRMGMQADHKANKGIFGIWSEAAGSISRTYVHVVGNTSGNVPMLTSNGRPILGTSPSLEFDGKLSTAQGGILFLGTGRMPVPVKTPFGTLLIQPPLPLSLPVANGKGTIPLAIPNDNNLKGVLLDWQGFVFDLVGGTWGMTNGTEWYVGLQN